MAKESRAVIQVIVAASAANSTRQSMGSKVGRPMMKQPTFDLETEEKYNELKNFRHSVMGCFLYCTLGPWNWRHKHSQLDVYIHLFTSFVTQAWGYKETFYGILKLWQMAGRKGCNQRTLWKGNSMERTL